MYYEIELRLPALTSCLHVVDACVGRLCRTALGGEDPIFQEAVRAACVHAIEHSYGGDEVDYRLELSFAVGSRELQVTLIDTGAQTDPLATPPLAEFTHQLEEAEYQRRDGANVLRLARRKAA
jgi:hypothetical protein